MSTKRHMTYMLIGGGAVLAAPMWVFGISLSSALPYAFLLACPLVMVVMMRGMDHGSMSQSSGSRGEAVDVRVDPTGGHQHPVASDLAEAPGVHEPNRR